VPGHRRTRQPGLAGPTPTPAQEQASHDVSSLPEGGDLSAGDAVNLQDELGNQAVAGMIGEQRAAAPPTPPRDGGGAGGPPQVTVVAGDTLWGLAARHLGDGRRWPEIYELNRAVVGPDPDLILPGQVLQLPAGGGSPGHTEGVGHDSGTPGEAGVPPAGETDEMCVPYVVLARGAAATEAAVAERRGAVEAVLAAWGLALSQGSVQLASEAGDGGSQQVVALTWDFAWGDLPSSLDIQPDLAPIDARVALTHMHALDVWDDLEGGTQGQLDALLGGQTNAMSVIARAEARRWVMDPSWSTQPSETQAQVLTELLTSDAARPALVDEAHPDIAPAPYVLSGPTLETGHAFRGVSADADVWQCVVYPPDSEVCDPAQAQTIPVYAPHAPDPANGHHYTVEQAVHALVRLPPASRALVTSITLNAQRNPDDAHWAVEYGDPNFESFMTAGAAGDITIYPSQGGAQSQRSIDDSMVHETGHTWSMSVWGDDTSAAAWDPWRNAMASDRISVSNYAAVDIAEDVAETVAVYNNTKGTPAFEEYRAMVPARFGILGGYF